MSTYPLPIVRTVAELRAKVAVWRKQRERVALVPTMGALHEGHLSLIRLAQQDARRVIVSLFVNPTQFGPHEDFAAYPRHEAHDVALLAKAVCDLMFAPTVETMYARGFSTSVRHRSSKWRMVCLSTRPARCRPSTVWCSAARSSLL